MDNISQLREFCDSCDLQAFTSPYLPKTFTKWRRASYRSSNYLFIKYVDEDLLPRFLDKLKVRYYDDIVNSESYSQQLGASGRNLQECEEFMQLAAVMAQWSVEIELATDIIDRAQLYGFYTIPKDLAVSYSNLQKEWCTSGEPHIKRMYRFLLHSVGYVSENVAGFIKTYIVGVVTGNLAKSKSIIVMGTVYAYMCGSVPWAVLAILGTQTAWVISGWLLVKIGKGIGAGFNRAQLRVHLLELKSQFSLLTGHLTDLNEQAKAAIMNCVLAMNTEDAATPIRELATMLNSLLHRKAGIEHVQEQYDEEEAAADCIQFYEENDWWVMDVEDPVVTQLTRSLFTIETKEETKER